MPVSAPCGRDVPSLHLHTQRIELTERLNRARTIYFSPISLSDSNIIFGTPRSSLGDCPGIPRIGKTSQSEAGPGNVQNNSGMSPEILQFPSWEQMGYNVERFAHGNKGLYDYSHSSDSDSNAVRSPDTPSSTSSARCVSVSSTTLSSGTSSSLSSLTSLPGASLFNHTGTIADMKRLSAMSKHSAQSDEAQPLPAQTAQTGPYLSLPPLFRSIALTDSNIAGQPIRFTSSAFEPGTNALKVGSCTFLNLPYGATTECGLRVEPLPQQRTSSDQAGYRLGVLQRIRLQIVQRVVYANTGRQAMLLCTETDVTEDFTSDVRAELVAQAGSSSGSSQVIRRKPVGGRQVVADTTGVLNALNGDTLASPSSGKGSSYYEDHPSSALEETSDVKKNGDIWLNIAKSLTHIGPISTHIPSSPTGLSGSSPALRDLLNLFNEIRVLHKDFFIIRMKTAPSNGPELAQNRSIRFSIPWLSAQLFQTLFAVHEEINDGPSNVPANDIEYNILAIFKDAMAHQLSPDIWPYSAARAREKIAELKRGERNRSQPFFKKIRLPVVTSRGGSFTIGSSQVRRKQERKDEEQGVYAIPMFDDNVRGLGKERMQEVRCYVCFLVDQDMEGLW